MQFKVTANFSLTLILISILGCQSTQPVKLTAEELTKISEGWSAAPVSYSGEASCPDCQNPRYQLNLLPGKVYLLKTTALAKEQSADNITDSMGRWELKDNLLTLNDGSGSVKSLTIIDADTLRMPVPNAKPETEQANQDLVRTQQFQALESHRTLSGIYSEKSGSATIEDCQTGLTFPVSSEGNYKDLKKAYGKIKGKSQRSIPITVDGKFSVHSGDEKKEQALGLEVEQLRKIWTENDCKSLQNRPLIEDLSWNLTHLSGKPINAEKIVHKPRFLLVSSTKGVLGTTGCTRFRGKYEMDGNKLKFVKINFPSRVCEKGADLDSGLRKTVEATSSWQFNGKYLELLDAQGASLARFEAQF